MNRGAGRVPGAPDWNEIAPLSELTQEIIQSHFPADSVDDDSEEAEQVEDATNLARSLVRQNRVARWMLARTTVRMGVLVDTKQPPFADVLEYFYAHGRLEEVADLLCIDSETWKNDSTLAQHEPSVFEESNHSFSFSRKILAAHAHRFAFALGLSGCSIDGSSFGLVSAHRHEYNLGLCEGRHYHLINAYTTLEDYQFAGRAATHGVVGRFVGTFQFLHLLYANSEVPQMVPVLIDALLKQAQMMPQARTDIGKTLLLQLTDETLPLFQRHKFVFKSKHFLKEWSDAPPNRPTLATVTYVLAGDNVPDPSIRECVANWCAAHGRLDILRDHFQFGSWHIHPCSYASVREKQAIFGGDPNLILPLADLAYAYLNIFGYDTVPRGIRYTGTADEWVAVVDTSGNFMYVYIECMVPDMIYYLSDVILDSAYSDSMEAVYFTWLHMFKVPDCAQSIVETAAKLMRFSLRVLVDNASVIPAKLAELVFDALPAKATARDANYAVLAYAHSYDKLPTPGRRRALDACERYRAKCILAQNKNE